MDLAKKTKKELIEEIRKNREEKKTGQLSFPGISVISKYERLLSESEEKYKHFFDQNPLPMWVFNKKTLKFTSVNDAAVVHYGYSREEFLSMTITKIHLKEELPFFLESINKQEKVANEYKAIWKHLKKNNDIIEALVFETNMSLDSIMIVCHDVSYQGQLEKEQLRAQVAEENNRKLALDINEKKRIEKRITESLKEKEILLKEVHHRVKNNLQVISSILNLQSSHVKDANMLNLLRDSQNRIKTMAFIHESLYQAKDFSSVNFSEYVGNLTKNILFSYMGAKKNIKIKLDVKKISLNLDFAISCGLIINELVSNSLKHAFTENKKGEISLSVLVNKEEIKLVVSDNGKGLPSEVDYRNTKSLGLQLVITLVEQLNGVIQLENKRPITKFIIKFNHKAN